MEHQPACHSMAELPWLTPESTCQAMIRNLLCVLTCFTQKANVGSDACLISFRGAGFSNGPFCHAECQHLGLAPSEACAGWILSSKYPSRHAIDLAIHLQPCSLLDAHARPCTCLNLLGVDQLLDARCFPYKNWPVFKYVKVSLNQR